MAVEKVAIVTAGGAIYDVTDLYTEDVISGTVHFRSGGRTLSNLLGDWPSTLAAAALLVSLVYARLNPVGT